VIKQQKKSFLGEGGEAGRGAIALYPAKLSLPKFSTMPSSSQNNHSTLDQLFIYLKPMALKVYGIPNCGTCKKALKWLDDAGASYEFINTKEQPPTKQMITEWVATLTAKPLRNTSGQSYRAIGDEKKTWTDDQWIEAFAADAMLLKRPLFVRDDQAVLVGFRATAEVLQSTLL
jgi:arsenate reductase